MPEIELEVGDVGHPVSAADLRELEEGGGAPTPKRAEDDDGDDLDGGGEGGGEGGDGAAHVDEEDRSGRADPELTAANTESEREEIRQRRRQERQEKKRRAQERQQNLERTVAQLTRQNQELTQQVHNVLNQQTGMNMNRLDTAIQDTEQAVGYFESLIEAATTKGDGKGVAEATSNLFEAKERAKELKAYKEAVLQQQRQPQQKRTAIDPTVVNYAKAFMGKNKWYGGPQSTDMDSRVLSQIDNAVLADGFDPRGPEYWAELESRAKRYLPHRFTGASRGGDDGGSADEQNGYNGRASRRSPVGGNSGDARGPKGGGEGYNLSAERVKAIKDAGKWDDPVERKKMIKAYQDYDKSHS